MRRKLYAQRGLVTFNVIIGSIVLLAGISIFQVVTNPSDKQTIESRATAPPDDMMQDSLV